MTRRPRWLTHLALGGVVSIVLAACSGGGTPTASVAVSTPATATGTPATATGTPATATGTPATATGTAAQSAGGSPAAGMLSYPESGDAPCGGNSANGQPYTGEFKRIQATDANTVVFSLCSADVAFLSKVAFSAFGINDTEWLKNHVPDASIVDHPNGTGPFKLGNWVRGSEVQLTRNDNYWGDKAKAATAVVRWSAEAAQRLVELRSGNVDGIDNPAPDDFAAIQGDAQFQLKPREGLNTFYVGFNNTAAPFDKEQVRQAVAMGIDRQRIVDNFYPPGSEVATHFTPCAIPGGCEGDPWYSFDPVKAKQMLSDAGYPNGFDTVIHLRDVVRGYLPLPKEVAQDIQSQLKTNLGINATIDIQESATYIDNASTGKLLGIHLLGWGADYPDPTNFLDYHFGGGASPQFGNKFEDVVAALKAGASGVEQSARNQSYAQANNAIRTHVPMIPIAHGGSGTAWKADVQGAHSSPLSNENLSVLTPGDRQQVVFMQNAEPPGLYCADESDGEALRVCEQILESLYAYEVGGTKAIPALAQSCDPNQDLTVWTCKLRQGVTFHDGSTFDANDVVLSYAVQWDTQHPLHKGRDNSFTYFPGLWGGFLNAPPPEAPPPSAPPSSGGSPAASPSGSPAGSPGGTPAASPAGSPSGSPAGSPAGSPSGSPAGSPSGSPSASPAGSPSGSPAASASASPS